MHYLVSRRTILAATVGSGSLLGRFLPERVPQERPVAKVCVEQDEIFYDENGLIVQQNCDGGDTAQREGMYWFGNWVRMNLDGLRLLGPTAPARRFGSPRKHTFQSVMDLLEDEQKSGGFRRHPTQSQPACEGCAPVNDPAAMSRDQMIPLIAAMGVYRDFDRLERFSSQHAWTLNRDVMIFFGEFVKRAKEQRLAFGGEVDKVLLDRAVDFHFAHVRKKGMDEVGDDLNLIVQLLLAEVRDGAKVKAIRARYVRERPRNFGIYLTRYRSEFPGDFAASKDEMIRRIQTGVKNDKWMPDCTSVVGALRWYFRREAGGSPGLARLYEPIMDAYFAGPIPG